MKCYLLPSSLSAALEVASKAVARKGSIPAVEGVLLEATPDGGLVATGTDLRFRAWQTVAARVDEPGAIILPVKPLQDFIGAVPQSDEIQIDVDAKHKAVLTCSRTVVRIAGLDAEGFPTGPSFDDPSADLTLAAPVFARLIAGVAHAASPDDSRPVLAGINLLIRDGLVTLVTADGFRLAMCAEEVEGLSDLSVIVHAHRLAQAASQFGKATSVRLLVDGAQSQLLIDTEAGSWAVALIDGQYPDWNRIVPRPADITNIVTVSRADLLRTAELIRNLTTEVTDKDGKRSHNTVMARLTVAPGELLVRAHDTTHDHEASAVIEAELEQGSGISITFNGGYFRDAVRALSGDRVTLELTAVDRPTIVRSAGDSSNVQIIMPMHVARPS